MPCERGLAAARPAASRLPITVIVPCYNEEATLGYTANTLQSFAEGMKDDFEISYVFVDDGSTDATWRRLRPVRGTSGLCPRAASHKQGSGGGNADRHCEEPHGSGLRDRLRRHLRSSAAPANDCDAGAGCRPGHRLAYHPEGRVLNLSLAADPVWGLSIIYRLFHQHRLYTYTSCFRVYRRSAADGIELFNEEFVGITEILSRLDKGRVGGLWNVRQSWRFVFSVAQK